MIKVPSWTFQSPENATISVVDGQPSIQTQKTPPKHQRDTVEFLRPAGQMGAAMADLMHGN